MSDAAKLWTTADSQRRFLIPDYTILPSGELTLSDPHNQCRQVDESAVLAFEITAQWQLGEQAETLLAQLRAGPTTGSTDQSAASNTADNPRQWQALLERLAGDSSESNDEAAAAERARRREQVYAINGRLRSLGLAPTPFGVADWRDNSKLAALRALQWLRGR